MGKILALKNEDITVFGEGTQTRSFCYVDDLIGGLIKLMDSDDGFTGPVNMGNPNENTILELAKKVIELTKSKSKIVYQQLPADDPCQRQPCLDLAKQKLNWYPKVLLEEGLKKTIAYFQNFLKEQ
ncbi:GDP-L-fucose synthase [subsurface metagenome]